MNEQHLETLRIAGYGPRSLLDIGAHLGGFTRKFLEVFPSCVPTLIEPNPFCHEALAKLPHERHAVAASLEAGTAQLFLTREWAQSTGASLYREDSHYFRDEVVTTHAVEKARIDDLFAGKRFDFVKIDTQGSELDVLRGGEAVLRQADYILIEISLVEFNKGGAPAEAVFAQLHQMGFRCVDAVEFHRLRNVRDGQLLQIDFLFERIAARTSQNFRYAPLFHHGPVLDYLRTQKSRCVDFSVIDVGASARPWSKDVLTASFDLNSEPVAPLHFTGNLNDHRSWDPLLRHVAQHGRFSYCICSHTLEDLAYPALTLEMLPRIANAGYIASPSRFLEMRRVEGPYRGFIHHRWVLDNLDGELILAPKLSVIDTLTLKTEAGWPAMRAHLEFQMHWQGAIRFSILNGDYMGPNRENVVRFYEHFFDRPL